MGNHEVNSRLHTSDELKTCNRHPSGEVKEAVGGIKLEFSGRFRLKVQIGELSQ